MSHSYTYHLAVLLASLSEKLWKSEIVKKLLIQQSDFDAYSIFRLLDSNNSESLTPSEILLFCKDHEIQCSDSDANLLFKWWDRDRDGLISLSDFLISVIPNCTSMLEITNPQDGSVLPPYAVRYSFIRVLQRELNLLRELEINRNVLSVQYAFNPQDAYAQISGGLEISPNEIFQFITLNGVAAVMAEVSLLVNRFDLNGNGISYLDFCEILDSGVRRNQEIPMENHDPLINTKSTFKEPTFRKLSPRAFEKSFQEELLSVLMYQIALDKALNELQKELCLMFDFTLTEAFKIFDCNSNGFITTWDLEKAFTSFGISPSSEEIFLIFRRYDRNSDGKFDMQEFSEFLCTKEPSYMRLLATRTERKFSNETIESLVKVLASHLTIESSAEKLRIEFSQRNDLYQAFNAIDENQEGVIGIEKLRFFFRTKNLTSRDIEILLKRYDRNQDRVISYAEFIQELTPQTPHHLW